LTNWRCFTRKKCNAEEDYCHKLNKFVTFHANKSLLILHFYTNPFCYRHL
jgi:hypothetical protein